MFLSNKITIFFLILSQKSFGSSGCFKWKIPINYMEIYPTVFVFFFVHLDQFYETFFFYWSLIQSTKGTCDRHCMVQYSCYQLLQHNPRLVCMVIFIQYISMLWSVVFTQVAHSVKLLLCSAEASVHSDKSSSAGWRLHPLQTGQESHPIIIRYC